MLIKDLKLSKLYSGKLASEEVLVGRGYLDQRDKATHRGIPKGSNAWVRDKLSGDSCSEARVMIALCLDAEFKIMSVYDSVRFCFMTDKYEDHKVENFGRDLSDALIKELQNVVEEIHVPKNFTIIGKAVPKILLEADWFPVGDGVRQWRCTLDGVVWNSLPPTDVNDLNTISQNNQFYTTINSNDAVDNYLVITIATDSQGIMTEFEVEKKFGELLEADMKAVHLMLVEMGLD